MNLSNLRELRTARNLTQVGLSALSGVSQTTISDLERGRGQVSLETAVALALALDVTVADLYQDGPADGENNNS